MLIPGIPLPEKSQKECGHSLNSTIKAPLEQARLLENNMQYLLYIVGCGWVFAPQALSILPLRG